MAPSYESTRPGESRSSGGGIRRRVWNRLCRYSFSKRRISRKSLERFCREMASDEYTLVVHSVDVDHRSLFPNSFVVSKRRGHPANLHTDPSFQDLQLIGDESFGVILCTGLFEHIHDPVHLVGQFHRILKPGGRLIVSASAVFPFHGAPDNYFHFTANGFRLLFRNWSRFDVLRGSSQPFETIAILLQRINIQCDVFPVVRPLIEILYHVVPWLDVFVLRQYDSLGRRDERGLIDSIMPVTLHAVVVK
jgi:SAM-dependent methyltransferase